MTQVVFLVNFFCGNLRNLRDKKYFLLNLPLN